MDKIIHACEEHIDMAIDDFVNQYEEAPEIVREENIQCHYCEINATYVVKSPEEFC